MVVALLGSLSPLDLFDEADTAIRDPEKSFNCDFVRESVVGVLRGESHPRQHPPPDLCPGE